MKVYPWGSWTGKIHLFSDGQEGSVLKALCPFSDSYRFLTPCTAALWQRAYDKRRCKICRRKAEKEGYEVMDSRNP